jgi:predicted ester cyclase
MTLEDKRALVQRFIDQVFVNGNEAAVDDLVTPDFEWHGVPGRGPDVLKAAIKRTGAALSDTVFRVHDTVAEGDRVAVRLTSAATQSGEFMGMPATNKRYEIEEIHLFRIADGRVAEHWHQGDMLGMMKQLGLMPGRG